MTTEVLNKLLNIKESFEMPEALFKMLLSDNKNAFLSEIAKSYDFTKDDFRDYFQLEHGDRVNLKQDYTPDCVCNLLCGLVGKTDMVTDVCSGTGALSMSFINNGAKNIICEEFSARAIPVLLCNLVLRNINAIIRQKNVITRDVITEYHLIASDKYSDIKISNETSTDKISVLISNPPYSMNWIQKRDERFTGYDLPPASKADYVFILDGLNRLDDSGRSFFILPHGVLFRGQSEGKIRQTLIENNLIDAVIGLPNNLFLNTGIPVCILCLKKNREPKDILFIDAQNLFEKNGKQNVMTNCHVEKIIDAYRNRRNVEKLCSVVSLEKIEYNDFNLNIPRYVDTSEEKEKIDLKTEVSDIIQIDEEITKINHELAGMIKNIHGNLDYEQNAEQLVRWLEHD